MNHVAESMKMQGRGLALALSALAAGVAGCAPDDPSADAPADRSESQALQAPTTQVSLPSPDGSYFADVTANGTGCPAGSWVTHISPDGQTFTTTFSQYEAAVDETTPFSIKDCNLAIKLHSPQGLSYAVTNFYYAGYAYLEEGVTGRQFANYYFQGAPLLREEVRTDLVGPYDQSYLFSDEVPITDAVWSPCGTTRDLNVVTRVRLQNSTPRRSGYMNLSAVDASTKLVIKLAWRSCTPGQTPTAAPDAGVTDAGVTDAGVADAGVADAGVADAGARDAGAPDAGRNAGRPGRPPVRVPGRTVR